MKKTLVSFLLVSCALASGAPSFAFQDGFDRERRAGDPRSALKDALEGRPAPDLVVDGWRNTDGESLRLADLRGSVVLLKFWGVW